jgi:tripartite-type tricarboxylate transporter receptor subunit TctC
LCIDFAHYSPRATACRGDAFAKLIRADTDKWGKVVKTADIHME